MVTAPALPPPCKTGTGNSPPTRKLASLPLVVTRLGSARIWRTPWAWSAFTSAPKFRSGRNAKTFNASPIVNLPSLSRRAPPNCWVPTVPRLPPAPVERKLTPNCWATVRSSSAKRTFRMICLATGAVVSARLLTTVLASGVAMASARSATSLLLTVPISVIESRPATKPIFSFGKVSFSSRLMGSRLCSTVTLYMVRKPVLAQTTTVAEPWPLPCNRNSREVAGTASTTSGFEVEIRLISAG